MAGSRLLILAQLFSIIALISAVNVQRHEFLHRDKRQSPADIFDTLYNQARIGTATLVNTLGGLTSGLQGRSGDQDQGAGNPLSVLTQGVSSFLTPVVLTSLAAGQDARRLLQQGADAGTNVLRTGIEAASEGSKTASTIVGTSLDGVRNLTDLGGNIFRSFLPNIGSTSNSDLDKSGPNPVSSFWQLLLNSLTSLKNIISGIFPTNRKNTLPSDAKMAAFNPISAFGQMFLRSPDYKTNLVEDSSSESSRATVSDGLRVIRDLFTKRSDPYDVVIPTDRKDIVENTDLSLQSKT